MHKDHMRADENSLQKLLCLSSGNLLCFILSHCLLFQPKVPCLPNIGARLAPIEARPGPNKSGHALFWCRKMSML